MMATIKDIAQMSGVSTATVSRIINQKGGASEKTIKKVNAVISRLGYEPDFVAKTLSQKASDLIALLVPNLTNPFFAELVSSIEKAADAHGYRVYLCNSEDDRDKVEYYLKFMCNIRVRGAIINSLYVDEDDLEVLSSRGIVPLTIDRACFSHPYAAMAVNNVSGSYQATKYLIQEGHSSRLVFISGPQGEKSSEDRYEGYLKAINKCSATHVAKLYSDFSVSEGYRTASDLFKVRRDIDGIVCSDDAIALGVLRAVADAGLRVPEDIRVIGYDNIEMSRYSVPRLSTVNQLPENIGDLVLDMFEKSVEAGNKPQKNVIEPHLVIRDTSQTRSA
ncbi:LacI family DNA-binding transcriptional regulator [Bifidobacterium sp. ESL0769]|uniref:LacI family DNA-binding transcriptional regulator n=1 Tax=Bifidobacterium sp. ESL0769 TaxID=2983229 RepID=UPI0023F841B1|nr:LacI family DNA-binding transcriptional regulator [Bifidobacterium sp. ESL0769]WEV67370.1 LacI family DNA-binding transcriptional regulator [Bifidobacterium sp. ESL0769]